VIFLYLEYKIVSRPKLRELALIHVFMSLGMLVDVSTNLSTFRKVPFLGLYILPVTVLSTTCCKDTGFSSCIVVSFTLLELELLLVPVWAISMPSREIFFISGILPDTVLSFGNRLETEFSFVFRFLFPIILSDIVLLDCSNRVIIFFVVLSIKSLLLFLFTGKFQSILL